MSVSDELVSSIQSGLCVLVGISRDDTEKDMDYMTRKLLNIRLFEDDAQSSGGDSKWMKSVVDRDLEILCVSQFTLQSTLKGNKPDFHAAMGGEQSRAFYDNFLYKLRKAYKPEKIKDGRFGAYMQVDIQNDGPVTILIDSKKDQQSATGKDQETV